MSATHDAAIRTEFYAALERIPQSKDEWARRRKLFEGWRADSRFRDYWPTLDHLLTVPFDSEASRRWAAADQAAKELRESGYDFNAYREQREFDRAHANDHIV